LKSQLVEAVFKLDEDLVISIVKEQIAEGVSPINIINDIQQGLILVGNEYDKGHYFIADLIMSGLIFNEVLQYIHFGTQTNWGHQCINVIFATVEHDIHDIGKNIANSFFRSRGVNVTDLGVDVPAEEILQHLKEDQYNLLFLSGLITTSFDSMKNTVSLIDEQGLRNKVKIIISGLVDESVRDYVNADGIARDVIDSFTIYEETNQEFMPSLEPDVS
jgi:methanogenic corrinoid protein MtbC1